ncbi:MAG TPA: rhodanese-like domain-containing protein, partial [Candidatus Acidoferrum sp.]|nr:rhodanese-like domain-containing protein [Candidatus Acidoferrum sp.]
PDAPAYFNYDAVLNSQERPTLDQALENEMNPLTLGAVLDLQKQGAVILDTRDPGEFASAHLKGSINIGLGGQFATWVGTLLDRKHQIVIIAAPGHEKEAAIRLGRIGFDFVRGYLKDGLASLKSHPELTAVTERLSAPFAAEYLSWELPPLLIDIRAPGEREKKHIPGSMSIPLNHLAEKLDALPKDRPVLVHCAGGYRSSIAASLLQKSGFPLVSEITGGLAAWEAAKLPISGH